jgi:hypothetical protein
MVRSYKRSPSFGFLRQNPECISLSLVRNICWPSVDSTDHEALVLQFSPVSYGGQYRSQSPHSTVFSSLLWWTVQITKHSFYSFLQSPMVDSTDHKALILQFSPVSSPLAGSSSEPSFNSLSLCSPLNVTDQLSDSYIRTGKYGNTSRHLMFFWPCIIV